MDQSDIYAHLKGYKALNIIHPVKSIYVKQKWISSCCSELLEIDIFEGNGEGLQQPDPIITCLKHTQCFSDLNFKFKQHRSDDEFIIELDQQKFCGTCSIQVDINLINKTNRQKIGSFQNSDSGCQLLSIDFFIMDKHNELRYQITHRYCQIGVICGCPCCEECLIVRYDINNNNNQKEGEMIHKYAGSCCFGSADSYYFLKFPINAKGEDKLLLMAAIILIDKSKQSKAK